MRLLSTHFLDPKLIHEVPIPSLVHRPSEDRGPTSSAGTELHSIIDTFKPLIASLPAELRDNVQKDEEERAHELRRLENKERPKKKRKVDGSKPIKPTANGAIPQRPCEEELSPTRYTQLAHLAFFPLPVGANLCDYVYSTLVEPSSSSATPVSQFHVFPIPVTIQTIVP
jgi:hypothetical protein